MTCSANVVGAGGSLRSERRNGNSSCEIVGDGIMSLTKILAISGCVQQPRRLAHALDVEIGGDGMGRLCKSAGSWRLCERCLETAKICQTRAA